MCLVGIEYAHDPISSSGSGKSYGSGLFKEKLCDLAFDLEFL